MSSIPLKIAQVTNLMESVPPLFQHGLEQLVAILSEELLSLGCEVTVFGTGDSNTKAKLEVLWPKSVMRDKDFNQYDELTFCLFIYSEVFRRSGGFDIIHDHTRLIPGFLAGLMNTPVITTLHHPIDAEIRRLNLYPEGYREYYKKIWMKSQIHNKVVAISHFQAEEFRKLYGYLPQVIHNGIQMPRVDWQRRSEREYLAFLGYITANKGVAEAVQAVLQTDEKLIIAGPLDDWEDNQKYFKEKVLPFVDGKKIKYIGPVGGQEKWEFLSRARAILMPIQWDEPFGLVAVESMASGTPVIAWNRAAMPEIIEDGLSGFLINSVEEMAERVRQIDQIDRSYCRKRAEGNFAAEVMTKKYLDYYHQVLKNTSA